MGTCCSSETIVTEPPHSNSSDQHLEQNSLLVDESHHKPKPSLFSSPHPSNQQQSNHKTAVLDNEEPQSSHEKPKPSLFGSVQASQEDSLEEMRQKEITLEDSKEVVSEDKFVDIDDVKRNELMEIVQKGHMFMRRTGPVGMWSQKWYVWMSDSLDRIHFGEKIEDQLKEYEILKVNEVLDVKLDRDQQLLILMGEQETYELECTKAIVLENWYQALLYIKKSSSFAD